jgi:hypothetical protein
MLPLREEYGNIKSLRRYYFPDTGVELEPSGLLGPLPISPHAAKVATAKITNNNWLTIFIDFSLL